MHKNVKALTCASFVLLLSMGAGPTALAAEDFNYSIYYEISDSDLTQGDSILVTITLEGRYVSEEPFVLDKQIEADVELLLGERVIGSAKIPAGPMTLLPYQDVSICEKVPGLIPMDAPLGDCEILVMCKFDSMGYSIDESWTFDVQIAPNKDEESVLAGPIPLISLSPGQIYLNGTTTLSTRVFNPNDVPLKAGVSLYSKSHNAMTLIGEYEIDLAAGATEEIRRTFKLSDGTIYDLGFVAIIDWYMAGEDIYSPGKTDSIDAKVLHRPSPAFTSSIENLRGVENDRFRLDVVLFFSNSIEWSDSVPIDELRVVSLPPEHLEVVGDAHWTYNAVRKNIALSFTLDGPLDEYYMGLCLVEGSYSFGSPEEMVRFTYPIVLPDLETVRSHLYLGPLGTTGTTGPYGVVNFSLTSLVMNGIGSGGSTDCRELMAGLFTCLEELFQ